MFKFGSASRNIVPSRPAMLLGQMHTRIAHETMDPLTITALALEGALDGAILPTQRGVDGGGYGVVPASCCVGPEGGQELVERTIQAIAEMFMQ